MKTIIKTAIKMNLKYFRLVLVVALFFVSCSENPITAFQNVNLIPMTDEKIVKNQTVLVKGKQIIKIGPANEIAIPKNSKIIEGSGTYLMPGLADMHMHTRDDWLSPVWPVSPFVSGKRCDHDQVFRFCRRFSRLPSCVAGCNQQGEAQRADCFYLRHDFIWAC
jgi:hypothetical protein